MNLRSSLGLDLISSMKVVIEYYNYGIFSLPIHQLRVEISRPKRFMCDIKGIGDKEPERTKDVNGRRTRGKLGMTYLFSLFQLGIIGISNPTLPNEFISSHTPPLYFLGNLHRIPLHLLHDNFRMFL